NGFRNIILVSMSLTINTNEFLIISMKLMMWQNIRLVPVLNKFLKTLLIIRNRILPLKSLYKKKPVINTAFRINVSMIYLLKKLNLTVTVLKWVKQLKVNYMKYFQNG